MRTHTIFLLVFRYDHKTMLKTSLKRQWFCFKNMNWGCSLTTAFVTCWRSRSGCLTGISMGSGSLARFVLACCLCRGLQRAKVVSVIGCSLHFTFNQIVMSSTSLLKSCRPRHPLAHQLKLAGCSTREQKEKYSFLISLLLLTLNFSNIKKT